MKIFRGLSLFFSLVVFLASCDTMKEPDVVRDNRFDFSASVVYDGDGFMYDLVLDLLSGTDGDYALSVTVDGRPAGGLADDGLVTLARGIGTRVELPSLGEGSHVLAVSLSHGGVENTRTVEFEEREPVDVGLDAGNDATVVTVRGTGLVSRCRLDFEMDGKRLEGVSRNGTVLNGALDVDFSLIPEYVFTLPETVTSGSHNLSVVLSSSSASRSVSLSFDEPFRNDIIVRTFFSQPHLRQAVEVQLAAGKELSYTVDYSIDGDPSLVLSYTDGKDFASGRTVTLGRGDKRLFLLPEGYSGAHGVTMRFSGEDHVSDYSLDYVLSPLLDMSVDVSGDVSVLTLESDGRIGSCFLKFTLDGSDYRDFYMDDVPVLFPYEHDFAGGASCCFSFPEDLAPGNHIVGVTVSTEYASYTASATFTEPVRGEFEAEISYSPYYMREVIGISMLSGKTASYSVSCVIDGDSSLGLYSTDGRQLGSSFSDEFYAGRDAVYLLPSFSDGEHTAEVTMTCGGRTLSWSFSWTVSGLVSVAVVGTTTPEPSIQIVGLVETSHSYTLSFRLDGNSCTVYDGTVSMGSSFKSEIVRGRMKTYGMRGLKLGKHILEVTVSSEAGSETRRVEFTNRRQGPLKLDFGFDEYEKRLTLSCPNNAYGEEIVLSFEETVTGHVKFIHKTVFATSKLDITTKNYEDVRRSSSFKVVPGPMPVTVDVSSFWEMMCSIHFDHHFTHQYPHRITVVREEFFADIDHVSIAVSFAAGSGSPAEGIPVQVGFSYRVIEFPYTNFTWDNSTSPTKIGNRMAGLSFLQPLDISLRVPATGEQKGSASLPAYDYRFSMTVK